MHEELFQKSETYFSLNKMRDVHLDVQEISKTSRSILDPKSARLAAIFDRSTDRETLAVFVDPTVYAYVLYTATV